MRVFLTIGMLVLSSVALFAPDVAAEGTCNTPGTPMDLAGTPTIVGETGPGETDVWSYNFGGHFVAYTVIASFGVTLQLTPACGSVWSCTTSLGPGLGAGICGFGGAGTGVVKVSAAAASSHYVLRLCTEPVAGIC